MKRSVAREIAVKLCFALSESSSEPGEMLEQLFSDEYYASLREEDEIFNEKPDKKQRRYITELVTGIHEHSAELDGYIDKYSTGWKFGRISRTAVAIMKLSMYEIMYMPEIPNSAAINEAIELAKRYEEPQTVSFVNGVLGSFSRSEPVQHT